MKGLKIAITDRKKMLSIFIAIVVLASLGFVLYQKRAAKKTVVSDLPPSNSLRNPSVSTVKQIRKPQGTAPESSEAKFSTSEPSRRVPPRATSSRSSSRSNRVGSGDNVRFGTSAYILGAGVYSGGQNDNSSSQNYNNDTSFS